MKRSAILSLLYLVAVPAFAAPADDATTHSKAFERAVNARDAKAILDLYASDAHVVWPGQGEEANGKGEIEKLVSNFLKELPKDAKITLKSQTAIPLRGGHIATVGHWDESFTDTHGNHQTVEIRTTELIKKEKDKTLYVVDHASIGLPPEPEMPAQQPGK
ncbi:MAG TPA: SgcJ/EcaC family oxidoreductase [Myxococcota bacterium]|nr:SgcJ/EcaC family oxidoreductase [Myxococcota bacterium]